MSSPGLSGSRRVPSHWVRALPERSSSLVVVSAGLVVVVRCVVVTAAMSDVATIAVVVVDVGGAGAFEVSGELAHAATTSPNPRARTKNGAMTECEPTDRCPVGEYRSRQDPPPRAELEACGARAVEHEPPGTVDPLP